ncbi:MAG: hypothetical protein NUV47_00485 [Patescibacteria group bacterium]|nr:hypothetical protein [Patescibacteria group bacterium]
MGGNYKTIKNIRWIVVVFILLSVFLFPWWFYVSLSLIALFYFDNFYEIILIGLAIDSLYTVELRNTFIALLLFVVSIYLKKSLVFFKK